jgi:hypothetical protein
MAGLSTRSKASKKVGTQRTEVRRAPARSAQAGRAPARRAAAGRSTARGIVARDRPGSAERTPLSEHTREIVALIMLGLAVFLVVALYGGDAAGSAGRGVRTGLVYAFGRLAFLVPLVLAAVAATTVFQLRFWRTSRFVGALLLVFGLFLLVGAGAPPIGSHGVASFVRAEFQSRSGGVGEALYALFHAVSGTAGVGIVGWLTALVGLILATGITGAWVGTRARRAADAVKKSSERSAMEVERRRPEAGYEEGAGPGVTAVPGPGEAWPRRPRFAGGCRPRLSS